jgi:hypothetical protein
MKTFIDGIFGCRFFQKIINLFFFSRILKIPHIFFFILSLPTAVVVEQHISLIFKSPDYKQMPNDE